MNKYSNTKYLLEDIFEGLDGFYKEIQAFLTKAEIYGDERQEIIKKIAESVRTQLDNSKNAKTVLSRIISLLKHNSEKGGNILEQLEYMYSDKPVILHNPRILSKTKELGLNVAHFSTALDKIEYKDFALENSALALAIKYEKVYASTLLHAVLRYLSKVLAFHRASIDSYDNYYSEGVLSKDAGFRYDGPIFILKDYQVDLQSKSHLQTVDYVETDLFITELEVDHREIVKKMISESEGSEIILSGKIQNHEKKQVDLPLIANLGIVTKNINLVNNFTKNQAIQNAKLLYLNVLSSSGKHYNQNYPEGEFDSYSSLFKILLSEFMIYEKVKVGRRTYEANKDYNRDELEVKQTFRDVEKEPHIKEIEEKHDKLILNFTNTYHENPEFNFGQIVALGLALNFQQAEQYLLIKNAKELLIYNDHFSVALRVTLATRISSDNDLPELKLRSESVARIINYLAKNHQIITENGKHPENIVFFSACFAKDSLIEDGKVSLLLMEINNLDEKIKNDLLQSFTKAQLPFVKGELIDNNFPQITIKDLRNIEKLNEIIANSQQEYISNDFQTRFNDISLNDREKLKIDLSELEKKFTITLPEELRDKTYKQIKKNIVTKNDLLSKLEGSSKDKSANIKEISREVLRLMFEGISSRDSNWKEVTSKTIELLFSDKKTLSEQFYRIEASKKSLDLVLRKSSNSYEKIDILNFLLQEPRIDEDALLNILLYLKEVDEQALLVKGHTIFTLLNDAGHEMVKDYFTSFKLASKAFIEKDDFGISLQSLYAIIKNLITANYSEKNLEKIINYCLENKDYRAAEILKQANGKADNISKIIDLIINTKPEDIAKMRKDLGGNIKKLFEFIDVNKITIITEIALKLGDMVTKEQYRYLIKEIKYHNLDYAKLASSYLLAFAKGNEKIITLVFKNLDSLENVQKIFSEENLSRFNWNETRVLEKIGKIMRLNGDKPEALGIDKQREIYNDFAQIMAKTALVSKLNENEVRERAIFLKHERMLMKDSAQEEIRKLDLEYIALSIEMMYRSVGKFPRDTQILSLLNSITQQGHVIEEIATSQGKSIITSLHAAYLSFAGQTVDVVTSNENLAIRDLEEFSSFYNSLAIKISRNIITATSDISEYNKGGVNYSVASLLALFRANREFAKHTDDLELKADVSLLCDEIDFALTSDINYKLAVSLVHTNQKETRALLQEILEFSETAIFKNENISRQEDIVNLELFLNYKFAQYDSSYKLPLSEYQIDRLNRDSSPTAQKLFLLQSALGKLNAYKATIFDKLLDAVIQAKTLIEGKDYVILKDDFANNDNLLKVTPIVKDQPSIGTMFGEGVQGFVHLLQEISNPELEDRFDISLPQYTIFNITPKNFFDYYRMTGGKIIGFTGTAGNSEEIEEFRVVNKILSFFIPQFEEDKKQVIHNEVLNKDQQQDQLIKLLNEEDIDRPILIFCENPKEARTIYDLIKHLRENVQISEPSDSKSELLIEESNAGKNGYITVTTPMQGRGTDFITSYEHGFLAVNLCTSITINDLRQIEGRVARNGHEGTVISLFNKEVFGEDREFHMIEISRQQKAAREKSQPLADTTQYLNYQNQDQQVNAINSNEFAKKTWKELVDENNKLRPEEQKNYLELRHELQEIISKEYPDLAYGLGNYLQKLDACIPKESGEVPCLEHSKFNASYVVQTANLNGSCLKINHARPWANHIDDVIKPDIKDSGARMAYYLFFQQHEAVMGTHIFGLESNTFDLKTQYNFIIKQPNSIFNSYEDFEPSRELTRYDVQVNFDGRNLSLEMQNHKVITLPVGSSKKTGIPKNLYYKIILALKAGINPGDKLESIEKKIILAYLMENIDIYGFPDLFQGQGSSGNLMVNEFKKAFTSYKNFVKSKEVNSIANIIDNFGEIRDLDISKLEMGKYQAIKFTTKFDSSASHAESILTNGKFLLWVNRGGNQVNKKPGIAMFKIIKPLNEVKEAVASLKDPKSQVETIKILSSLILEDGKEQKDIDFVQIEMTPQKTGNCAWVQSKTMLKAAAIVGRIGDIDSLPNVKDGKWQKILKDSNDIYRDFVKYHKIQKLEEILYIKDPSFIPQFLEQATIEEIDSRRKFLDEPFSRLYLQTVTKSLIEMKKNYENTIYEKRAKELLDKISTERVLDKEEDSTLDLVRTYGPEKAKEIVSSYYQNGVYGSSDDIDQVIFMIHYHSKFINQDSKFFIQMVEYILENNYVVTRMTDFFELISSAQQECILNAKTENCAIDFVANTIYFEEAEMCEPIKVVGYDSLFTNDFCIA